MILIGSWRGAHEVSREESSIAQAAIRTNRLVSLGDRIRYLADWVRVGACKDSESLDALRVRLDEGVDFLDTADVYGDHTSERLIAGVLKERREQGKSIPIVATKIGRRLRRKMRRCSPTRTSRHSSRIAFKALDVDVLDLVQVHCPPMETYYRPEAFDAMDRLQREGKIRFHGVSVEKVREGLKGLKSRRRQRPDRLQCFSSAARSPVFGGGAQASGRGHRRVPCERSLGRQIQARQQVCRKRPSSV